MKLTGQKGRRISVAMPVLAALAALASGCGYTVDQEGELKAAGFNIEGCALDSPYELQLDFVGFDDCDDILYLRIQKGGRHLSDSDGVEIQIHKLAEVQDLLESGPATLELGGENVRVTVYFNKTCPESFVPLEAGSGTLTIDTMSLGSGGRLVLGAQFDLVDLRTGEVVGNDVTLSVEAELSTSSPYKGHTYCL